MNQGTTHQPPLLYLNQVEKSYGDTLALRDVNLTIEAGKIIGLLGPNGSGKTTLIKLINGLLQPSFGQLYLQGQTPSPQTKKIVSYLPDTTYLSDNMTIEGAFQLFQDFYDDFDKNKAYQLVAGLQLNVKDRFKKLSKGNKEKVQLILVMSRQADLYVLDEPIGGVDPAARDYILRTIIQNRSPQSSVIISTHLIADVETILDQVIFINQGNILLHQDAAALRQQYNQSIDNIFRSQFRIY